MAEGREYELRFTLEPQAIGTLPTHPLLKAAFDERETVRLRSTYYDMPGSTLRRARAALRIRVADGTATETLKGPGTIERGEWEHENNSGRPDVAWLRSTPLGGLFADDAASLAPCFTVDVSRTVLPISYGESRIEGAVDCGVISAGGRFLEVSELELELKHGAETDVLALARALAGDLPLVLSLTSKSERGYALAAGRWGVPEKKIDLALSSKMTLGDTVAAGIQGCLAVVCRNAALIGRTEDEPEAVHATRISLRHLQAAMDVFEPALKQAPLRRMRAALKEVAHDLGTARDADVFQGGTFDEAAARGDPPGAPAVADLMRRLQREAHDRLAATLASPRWRLSLVDLLAMSRDGVKRRPGKRRAASFVDARLADQHRTLSRHARALSALSAEALHAIRKRAKRLRYALDLLARVAARGGGRHRAMTALADELHKLQQALGAAHDPAALRAHLTDVVLRRDAPEGIAAEQWQLMQAAAAKLADLSVAKKGTLGRARKAAKRVRWSKAF